MIHNSKRKWGISIRNIMKISKMMAEIMATFSSAGTSSRAIAQVRNVAIMNNIPLISAEYPNPCCIVSMAIPMINENRLRIMII
jgi:hypothetical protein